MQSHVNPLIIFHMDFDLADRLRRNFRLRKCCRGGLISRLRVAWFVGVLGLPGFRGLLLAFFATQQLGELRVGPNDIVCRARRHSHREFPAMVRHHLPLRFFLVGAANLDRHTVEWAVVGTSLDQVSNPHFRRPCAGFHPQVYAQAHPDACVGGNANPLAHWLRAGRPSGPWSRQVFSPLDTLSRAPAPVRVALHAHFYHVLSARDLAARLGGNHTRCDLFLSTDASAKAEHLRTAFAGHGDTVRIRVMPNRGRDIGPLLTGFAREIVSGGYDVLGHVHGKQSLSVDAGTGNLWREFLWENLIGGSYPMLDVVAAAFATQPDLGLMMAEDPHLVGWDANRAIAETLAARMGVGLPLDDFFDFPLGNMFWARPGALAPLLALDLAWEDYPAEPLPYDGTLLHALERIVPYAAQLAGFSVAGLRVPGTTW